MIAYRRAMRNLIAIALALTAACGKGGDKSAPSDDPGLQFVAKEVKKDLEAAKANLAANTPEKAQLKCAQLSNPDVEKADAALWKDYRQTCAHDIPAAVIKNAVEKAEAARKAKPTDNPLMECYDANYSLAVKDLETYKTGDAASTALIQRWAATCPDTK